LINSGSVFFIFYAISIFITRPFTGKLFDKKGENFVMYPAILVFSIAFLVLSQAHNGISIILVAALAGFGYGTFSSSAQAIAIKVSPKHRMGLATSTSFMFGDLGAGIGPFILGYFVPLAGYRGLYMIIAVIVLFCLFLYYLLHGRKAMYESEDKQSISA
jgi:MFS family permease